MMTDESEVLVLPDQENTTSNKHGDDDDVSGARFPIIEQPARCLLVAGMTNSSSTSTASPTTLRYLTCYKNGTVTTANRHHGPKQEFMLIPDTTERGLLYIKHVKFNTFVGVVPAVPEEEGQGILAGLEQETATSSTSSKNQRRSPLTLQSSEVPYKWLMIKSSEKGAVMFQSLEHPECTISCDVEGNVVSTGANSTTWHIEFLTGELLFMSEPNMGRVRCDLVGTLSLSENFRGWEVWRLVETGDGGAVRINSWMHSQFYLCINGEGRMTTCTLHQALSKPDEFATKWLIQKAEKGVVIRNADCGDSDKMLSVNSRDGSVCAFTLESCSDNAISNIWQLEAAHLQQYTMLCSAVVKDEQKQLSLGPFPYVTPNLRQSDVWKIVQSNDGSVALFSQKAQQYLAYGRISDENAEGTEIYLEEKKSASSQWLMEPSATEGGGGFVFRTKSNGNQTYLSFQEAPGERDGTLCVSSEPTVWTMDPCLPRAVSSAKIKTFAIGTSLAVGTTIAMPFALAGVGAILGAVGAEVGLFANIVAAGLTGAEAIASAGVIAGTAALVFRESGDSFQSDNGDEDKDETKDNPFSNRPFCAWRTWKQTF